MKRSFLLAGTFIIVCMTIASCKQEHVCKCSKTYTSGTGTNEQNYAIYAYTDTRRKADERCHTNNENSGDFDGAYTVNCHIE